VNLVNELLLRCSKAKISNSARSQIRKLLIDERLDWNEVMKKAREQSIIPSLYYNLQQWELAYLIPPKIEKNFKKIYLTNAARNATIFYHLSKLLRYFQENHIPVVVLKGAALAATIYPLPSLRMMYDVDLLLKKADVVKVNSLLLDLNYTLQPSDKWQEERAHHIYMSPNKLFCLEIHWLLASQNSPTIVDITRVWQRAKPLQIEDVKVLALSPEDLIQHLCIHTLSRHNFYSSFQLRNIYDLWAIIDKYGNDKIDWDYLLKSSRQYRTSIFVYFALRKLDESQKLPFLKEVLKKFQPDKENIPEKELFYMLKNESFLNPDYLTNPIIEAVADLLREKGIIPKIKYLIKRIFRSSAILAQRYGLSSSSRWIYLYYFLHPLILFVKYTGRLNYSSLRNAYHIGRLKAKAKINN